MYSIPESIKCFDWVCLVATRAARSSTNINEEKERTERARIATTTRTIIRRRPPRCRLGRLSKKDTTAAPVRAQWTGGRRLTVGVAALGLDLNAGEKTILSYEGP